MSHHPQLIAHRGLMREFPENTLLALRAALEVGARHVEFDIQLSADRVPMLFHDDTLERTTNEGGGVLDRSAAELGGVSAHAPALFGDLYFPEPIPRLADAVALLNRREGVTAFVEIKRQSLMRWGVEECVDAIESVMAAARFEWVLISFIQDALEYAHRHHHRAIGWVLREYNLTALRIAEIMHPEFLFCKFESLPQPLEPLWSGDWHWVIYDIEDRATARQLHELGAEFIETGCIDNLLEGQRLPA